MNDIVLSAVIAVVVPAIVTIIMRMVEVRVQRDKNDADVAKTVGETYKGLIDTLESRVKTLEADLGELSTRLSDEEKQRADLINEIETLKEINNALREYITILIGIMTSNDITPPPHPEDTGGE